MQLTESARAVLRAEHPLTLAMPRLSSAALVYRPKNQPRHHYDKDLFARLRFLRKQIADQENIPPYVVFNDATLQEMAEFLPITEEALLAVNGVGERKLERFGNAFLQLIQSHVAKHST